MALQTPKLYLAGSKRAQKSGFLRSIDRKKPQFEQALKKVHGLHGLTRISVPQNRCNP
ncbi:MAG: hypothetical protein LBD18_07225 [Treponema sp.]|nr:hypothetical protein [Treponema sp.]